jgi:hypothetical protein
MIAAVAHRAEGFVPLELRRLLGAVPNAPVHAATLSHAEVLTARSLASVGLACLLALPLLVLASLVVRAPIAGAAVIAVGYLAMAQAIIFHRQRQAFAWTAAVLVAFVAWTFVILFGRHEPAAWPAIVAAILVPALASAPAIARRLLVARQSPGKMAAEERAACLTGRPLWWLPRRPGFGRSTCLNMQVARA